MGLSKLFGSKAKEKDGTAAPPAKDGSSLPPPDVKHPVSQFVLAPGFYGNIPASFAIYFAGFVKSAKTDYYFVADERTAEPIFAFAARRNEFKLNSTLFSGPTVNTAPLSVSGIEKTLHSRWLIGLPSAAGGGSGPTPAQAERLVYGKMALNNFYFTMKVGADQHIETFEWRADEPLKPTRENPCTRTLVRLNNPATGTDETIGTWVEDAEPERNHAKLGSFHFQGSAMTGELGPQWLLMAVMTLINVAKVKVETKMILDGLVNVAVGVTKLGVGFAG